MAVTSPSPVSPEPCGILGPSRSGASDSYNKSLPRPRTSRRRYARHPMCGSTKRSPCHIEPVSGASKRKLENRKQRLAPQKPRSTPESMEIADQRLGCTSLTSRDVGDSRTSGNRTIETGLAGWGGSNRTSEWRNQNPTTSLLKSTRILNKSRNSTHYIPIGWRSIQNAGTPRSDGIYDRDWYLDLNGEAKMAKSSHSSGIIASA